jgi:hypothetical protein
VPAKVSATKPPAPNLDPFPAPTFDAAPILEIIEELVFRAAREKDRFGRAQVPHSYCVRTSANEAAFVRLFTAVQEYGRIERYNKRPKRYLYLGEFKYWAMSPVEADAQVLNRMLVIDDLERLIREGQVEPPG